MTQPPQPPDPYERYRVEGIEKDKHEKADWKQKSQEAEKESNLGAYFLSLLKRFVDWFHRSTKKSIPSAKAEDVKKHLATLKEIFETLKTEDRSQETPFLAHLADTWHALLDDALKFRKTAPLSNRYFSLIREIETYPEKIEHPLGYYLMEYKGQAWLPFPFMELIQKIHLEHKKNPEGSKLTEWTQKIELLLADFKD